MPLLLNHRDTESMEWMDDPDCSTKELFNTYRQFSTINAMISGWKHIYRTRIKPRVDSKNSISVLDIGFGGGDIPLKLAKWARADNIKMEITAIETDPRAIQFVDTIDTPNNISFEHISSSGLLKNRKRFDIVISNHLLHHLRPPEFDTLLAEAKKLSTKAVFFSDIERSDIGYVLFNLFARPVFRSSFITHDGLTSIKRSYTLQELRQAVPADWNVERKVPFRLILSYSHDS